METEETMKDNRPIGKLVGILVSLLLLHFVAGYTQTPNFILEMGIQKGAPEVALRIGYAISIFAMFALPLPMIISLLSLIFKANRNLYSFFKIMSWCLVCTLLLSTAYGFWFANFMPNRPVAY